MGRLSPLLNPTEHTFQQASPRGSGACWKCGFPESAHYASVLEAPEPQAGPACSSCGQKGDGGYEVEDGPGPFCSGCWQKLEEHFAAVNRHAPGAEVPDGD